MAVVKIKTEKRIPERVSPFREAIPAGAIVEVPQPWYYERDHSPILEQLTVDEYYEAVARGDALRREPDEAPEHYHELVGQDEEGSESEPEPEGPTEAEKIQEARTLVAEQEGEIAETLPDEEPSEDEPAARRILWALLNGGYQARQSILADTSDRSAKGTSDEIEDRLYAELYDREMAEG